MSKTNIKKIIFLSVCSFTFGVSCAVSAELPNNLKQQEYRYIMRLKNNQQNILQVHNSVKNKLDTILLDSKLKADITIEPITQDQYLVSIKSKLSSDKKSVILNKLSYGVYNTLAKDKTIKYIVKDRQGYFKPLPLLNADTSSVPYKLNHSAQWDEFTAPGGVYLESKPFMSDGAWKVSKGASNNPVTVAVLDTGIEFNNNLTASVLDAGWNFSANNNDTSDETASYHGTHVVGTIAANGVDVIGMAPEVKILPVKIPRADGLFFESNVIKAIYWASGANVPNAPKNSHPAKVINMSFGIDEYVDKEVDECSPAVQDAINYATNKGVVLVVAAGNSNLAKDLGSPGGCTGVIRVAATGPTGLRSYYSNFGEGITLAAPGGDKKYGLAGGVLSTVKDGQGLNGSGLDFFQGTSMAAPHVSGLAALIQAVGSEIKPYTSQDVEKLLYTTTHNFGVSYDSNDSCRGEKSCGHGIINANNALNAALANYDVLFSAPRPILLNLVQDENCRPGMSIPSQETVVTREGTWQLEQSSVICQKPLDYNYPALTLDANDNIIRANYGQVTYALNHNLNNCKQIGYDGVGCFN